MKNKLFAECEEDRQEVIDLSSKLIRIPSENPPGNTIEIIEFIKDWLKNRKINNVTILSKEKTKPNLIVEIGSGNPVLALNGHADVVPAGDRARWEFDPFSGEIKNGLLLGRGASDMKAGLAGIIYAFRLIAKYKDSLKGTLRLIVVSDEEVGGECGSGYLYAKHKKYMEADGCIIAEPSDSGKGGCTIGQKGNLWVKFSAKGMSAHGSLGPYVGDNAIVNLSKLIPKADIIRSIQSNPPSDTLSVMKHSKEDIVKKYGKPEIANVFDHVTVNIGLIKGGDAPNIVPALAEMVWDMRVPIGIGTQKVMNKIQEITKDSSGISVKILEKGEPNYTPIDTRIIQSLAKNVKKIIGMDLNATYQWASSDARLFRCIGTPTLQFGPSISEGIHSFNEKVKVDDIISATKVYLGTIVDFFGMN